MADFEEGSADRRLGKLQCLTRALLILAGTASAKRRPNALAVIPYDIAVKFPDRSILNFSVNSVWVRTEQNDTRAAAGFRGYRPEYILLYSHR